MKYAPDDNNLSFDLDFLTVSGLHYGGDGRSETRTTNFEADITSS